MRPGDLVECRCRARLRTHHAGVMGVTLSVDTARWASELETGDTAVVLGRYDSNGEADLYVMGPQGCGWIWETSMKLLWSTPRTPEEA